MLIIYYNYNQKYKNTITLLTMALNIKAKIVYLQKPFIKNKNIIYSVFNFYWLKRLKIKV